MHTQCIIVLFLLVYALFGWSESHDPSGRSRAGKYRSGPPRTGSRTAASRTGSDPGVGVPGSTPGGSNRASDSALRTALRNENLGMGMVIGPRTF